MKIIRDGIIILLIATFIQTAADLSNEKEEQRLIIVTNDHKDYKNALMLCFIRVITHLLQFHPIRSKLADFDEPLGASVFTNDIVKYRDDLMSYIVNFVLNSVFDIKFVDETLEKTHKNYVETNNALNMNGSFYFTFNEICKEQKIKIKNCGKDFQDIVNILEAFVSTFDTRSEEFTIFYNYLYTSNRVHLVISRLVDSNVLYNYDVPTCPIFCSGASFIEFDEFKKNFEKVKELCKTSDIKKIVIYFDFNVINFYGEKYPLDANVSYNVNERVSAYNKLLQRKLALKINVDSFLLEWSDFVTKNNIDHTIIFKFYDEYLTKTYKNVDELRKKCPHLGDTNMKNFDSFYKNATNASTRLFSELFSMKVSDFITKYSSENSSTQNMQKIAVLNNLKDSDNISISDEEDISIKCVKKNKTRKKKNITLKDNTISNNFNQNQSDFDVEESAIIQSEFANINTFEKLVEVELQSSISYNKPKQAPKKQLPNHDNVNKSTGNNSNKNSTDKAEFITPSETINISKPRKFKKRTKLNAKTITSTNNITNFEPKIKIVDSINDSKITHKEDFKINFKDFLIRAFEEKNGKLVETQTVKGQEEAKNYLKLANRDDRVMLYVTI